MQLASYLFQQLAKGGMASRLWFDEVIRRIRKHGMHHAGPLSHVRARVNDHAWRVTNRTQKVHDVRSGVKAICRHAANVIAKSMQEFVEWAAHIDNYIKDCGA
jgi:hypothetical protein